MVAEISAGENVQSGKHRSGERFSRESLLRGIYSVGESVVEVFVRVVSVGDLSSENCQSGIELPTLLEASIKLAYYGQVVVTFKDHEFKI